MHQCDKNLKVKIFIFNTHFSMNKTIIRTIAVCIAIPIGFFVIFFAPNPRAADIMPGLGLAFSIAGLLYIIPGVVLVISKRSRQIGQGVLLSVALLLLVGFSFCSMNPISFQ